MAKAAVLGARGYLGGELLRLLSNHPRFEVASVVSRSGSGRSLGELHPNLARYNELPVLEKPDAVDVDVAFIAETAGESSSIVPGLLERGIRVVDLGPDYRLKDPEVYGKVYRRPHGDPSHLGEAVYGLTEWFRDDVRNARLVANPGCYSTATLLALAPLVHAHALSGPVVVDAKSGSSGAGASLSPETHHPEAAGTVWPYGTPEHRHVPEIRETLALLDGGVSPVLTFVPHVVPLVRGILCSIYPSSDATADPSQWPVWYSDAYSASAFVRFGEVPRLPWVQGTNRCYLSLQSVSGRPVVFSALDNLGKGGAGQAIQNANVMFGFDETAGLGFSGFGV